MSGLPAASLASPARLATVGTVPRIGHGFRLQWEPAQSCFVLLYPEGMVKLNQSAGEIMKRCDGARDVAAIVADLETAFATSGLEGEVLAFIDIAGRQHWLAWEPAP
jgi:pyrroloquinoline quinone biosynthesis protein D